MAKNSLHRLLRILRGDAVDGLDASLLDMGLSKLERFTHFWVLVGKSFVRNRCLVRASALSYTTLLALIPLLAVAMSVTSSLLKSEGEDQIYQFVDNVVASVMPHSALETNAPPVPVNPNPATIPVPEETNAARSIVAATAPADRTNSPAAVRTDTQVVAAQKEAAKYIHEFIQNTRSGALGVTGMVVLVFAAISLLSRVEETFNDIWGVTRGRNWFVRIVQYWAVISLGPLLIMLALGLAGGSHLQKTKELLNAMPFIGGFSFRLLPLIVLWLVFALLYQLVPNTKVHFNAALVGGVVAGSLWFLNNMFGFLYVSRVVTNSRIYGSLGLVPVFMVGLYFSWVIGLFGAQVAYAFQNRIVYLQEKLAENVNQRGREFVALRLMTCIGQRFQRSLPPATVPEISGELGVTQPAGPAGIADAAHRSPGGGGFRRRTGLRSSPATRSHQLPSHPPRHAGRAGTGTGHARRTGAGGGLRRICAHSGGGTTGRLVCDAARAGQPGPSAA